MREGSKIQSNKGAGGFSPRSILRLSVLYLIGLVVNLAASATGKILGILKITVMAIPDRII